MPQAAATTSQAAARRAEQRQQLETLENQLCRDCKVSYNCMLYFNYTKKYLPYTRLLDYTYTDILELLDFFDFSPLKAKPRGEAKAELSKAKQSLAAENETRPGLGA